MRRLKGISPLVLAWPAVCAALLLSDQGRSADPSSPAKAGIEQSFSLPVENKLQDNPGKEPDVIFVPTPQEVVEKMLELARVSKHDVVYDLGCGDGRIVLTAARKHGCKAVGYDLNARLIRQARASALKQKLNDKVAFLQKDIFKLNLADATVVTLYLLPSLNVKLVPQLNKMRRGSRIVSHAFDLRGYKPDKKKIVRMKDGRDCDIYLWTIPLKPE